MKVVYAPNLIQPVVTASSSNGTNTPDNAVDGDTTTYWESNNETNPYIQIDFTKILGVDRVVITFDSVNKPSSFNILTSENATDQEYGTFSGAFDLQRGSLTPATGDNVYTWDAKNFRYLRIQMNGTGQMRIKEIGVWAPTGAIQRTVSRMKILSTYFTQQGNDLIDLFLDEGPVGDKSEHINQVTFKLNNANISSLGVITDKYLQATFPTGSRALVWLDGVLKLYGNLVEFIPTYGKDGFFVNGTIRDFGEFLIHQKRRQAWTATTYSDQTLSSDVISQGPFSLLGMCLNSVGARYFPGTPTGYLNIANTIDGPNTISYLKMNSLPLWTMIGKVADEAMKGGWFLQNQTFGLPAYVDPANPANVSDGFWVGYVTDSQFSVGFPSTGMSLNVIAAIGNFGFNNSLNNSSYDGSAAADGTGHYAEGLQPTFFAIKALKGKTDSLQAQWTAGAVQGFSGAFLCSFGNAIEIIVETIDTGGNIRRLHYLSGNCGGLPTTNTSTDVYLGTFGTWYYGTNSTTLDIWTDYTTYFGASSDSDTCISIRARSIPSNRDGVDGVTDAEVIWNYIKIVPPQSVPSPPQRYDFYVTTTLSSGTLVPDLAFFPRPRPGTDNQVFVPGLTSVGGRLLDDTNTIRFYTDFPRSDLNNMESFRISQVDLYTTSNEVSAKGTQAFEMRDNAQIPARDALYLSGKPPYNGSAPPAITLVDVKNMTVTGRRTDSVDISSPDVGEVARSALSAFSQANTAITRGVIRTRGNPYLAPGFVVFLDSTFANIAGYWYIISAKHDWNIDGYFTEVTVANDRFRFSSELLKLQLDTFHAGFRTTNTQGTAAKDTKTFYKTMADLNALETSPGVEITAGGQPAMRFPLWFIPEFSCIKHLTISTSRILGTEGKGSAELGYAPGAGALSPSGWDTDTPLWTQGGLNDEKTLLPHSGTGDNATWVATRFVMPTVSTSRMLVSLADVRRPGGNTPSPNSFIKIGIFDDGTEANPTDLLSIVGAGELIVGLLGGPAKKPQNQLQGGWNQIPMGQIIASGADAPLTCASTPSHLFYCEFENPNLYQPGKVYWLVVTTLSANSNVYIGGARSDGTCSIGIPSQAFSGRSTDGKSWLQDFNRAFTMTIYPQKSLTSAGAGVYGAGNGLTIFEPLTGKAKVATSSEGFQQTVSVIDFPTQIIARRNTAGNVDVALVTSTGVTAGVTQKISRWDYACTAQFEKF